MHRHIHLPEITPFFLPRRANLSVFRRKAFRILSEKHLMSMVCRSHTFRRVFASRRTLPIALGLVLLGLPAGLQAGEPERSSRAQQASPAPAQAPTPPATVRVAPATRVVSPRAQVTSIYFADDALLQTKVELDARDMPVVDALKSVLDQAKIKYEIDADVPTDKKVTMTLKNVPLSAVLTILTREAGVGWHYSKKLKAEKAKEAEKADKPMKFEDADFETSIRISKKGTNYYALMPNGPIRFESPQALVDMTMQRAKMATELANVYALQAYTPARMPDKLVKVDARNQNLRDVLKDVLKQADLDYALEDDVPEDVKRSFTFENVPIAMALDVICRSAEIGWRAERAGTGRDAKVVVRIGKKYATRLRGTVQGQGFGANFPFTPTPVVTMPNEQRVSFTCPHCKSKVRVVRDPKDEKQKAWKFCPVCGKPVDVQSFLGTVPARFRSGMEERHLNLLMDLHETERPLFGLHHDLDDLEPLTLPLPEILEEFETPVFQFELEVEHPEETAAP
jgi:predicted RNA-binding Zn-ribbon protein involved in translation (DUF1610 family)